MAHPVDEFEIEETPEWTLDLQDGDLLESYYSFNWDPVKDTLAKIRRFRYIQPVDAREALLKMLLPVLDGFENIFSIAKHQQAYDKDELANYLKSFEAVYKRLLKVIDQQGVRPIESIGQPVNLDCHEVVRVELSENTPEGTIVDESQKGYLIEDRVLRDAKVVVAKSPLSTPPVGSPDKSGPKPQGDQEGQEAGRPEHKEES